MSATPLLPEHIVVNARNKERFAFRTAESSPEELRFDFTVGTGGKLDLVHMHLDQHEVFRCVSGELVVKLDERELVLRPGDVVELPPGTFHSFANRGDVDAVCDVSYRPAGRNADWLRIFTALDTVTGQEPGMLDMAPFILDVGIYIAGPPVWAQRLLWRVLGPIARLLGRDRRALAAAEQVYGRPFTW